MSRCIAVVLARAGSKGVPNKNIADIAGRPCVAWTIEHALNTRQLDAVVVSSDSRRVLDIARDMSTTSHERTADLAADQATVDDAARSAVAFYDAQHDTPPSPDDAIVILYGNVPVRPTDISSRAIALLHDAGCDSVQSYAPVGKHHPWWTAKLNDSGLVAPWEGDTLNHGVYRRQDLPPAFVPDGGVLVVTRQALFGRIDGVEPGPHAFLGLDRRGLQTNEGEVVDIDSPIDLIVADAILRTASTATPA